jgi:hypothetical protein
MQVKELRRVHFRTSPDSAAVLLLSSPQRAPLLTEDARLQLRSPRLDLKSTFPDPCFLQGSAPEL